MSIPAIYRDPRALGAGDCKHCKGEGIETDMALLMAEPDPSKPSPPCHVCKGTGHAPPDSKT